MKGEWGGVGRRDRRPTSRGWLKRRSLGNAPIPRLVGPSEDTTGKLAHLEDTGSKLSARHAADTSDLKPIAASMSSRGRILDRARHRPIPHDRNVALVRVKEDAGHPPADRSSRWFIYNHAVRPAHSTAVRRAPRSLPARTPSDGRISWSRPVSARMRMY